MTHQSTNTRLAAPSDERLETLFSWFSTDHDVATWGGPTMRLPMTLDSMKIDARLDALASFFLVDNTSTLGFGQYYLRLHRCHLGRLVVAPAHRGQRLGGTLIERLASRGKRALNVNTESLFVLKGNVQAIRLYQRLGFLTTPYPGDDIDQKDFLYMIRKAVT